MDSFFVADLATAIADFILDIVNMVANFFVDLVGGLF